MREESVEVLKKEGFSLKELRSDLKESTGMMVVGAVLFAVLTALTHANCANGEHIKNELLAHQQVFLGINQQAAGLAIFFCGIFFLTAGSPNASFFAERFVIPFTSFFRDGAAIATGAFLAETLKVLSNHHPGIMAEMAPSLQSGLGWFSLSCTGTAIILQLRKANDNKDVKLNFGTQLVGAACLALGFVLILELFSLS